MRFKIDLIGPNSNSLISKSSNLKSHSQSLIPTLRNNHDVIFTYNFRSSMVAQPQWPWLNWNNLRILIKQDIHSCSQKLDEVRISLASSCLIIKDWTRNVALCDSVWCDECCDECYASCCNLVTNWLNEPFQFVLLSFR